MRDLQISAFDSFHIVRAKPMDYQRLYFCRECARELWLYCQEHAAPMLVGRRERTNGAKVEYIGTCPSCLEQVMHAMPEGRHRELLKFIFEFNLLEDLFSIAQYILPAETVVKGRRWRPLSLLTKRGESGIVSIWNGKGTT